MKDELSPPPLIGRFYEVMRSVHIQFRHCIDTHPSNSGIIIISSSLSLSSKGYPETSHLSYDIRPCHKVKVLEHLSNRYQKPWITLLISPVNTI